MTATNIERRELAQGLTIARALTGLWQIADMERDGRTLDPDVASEAMLPYASRGLTTFDMADHYGSAEIIAGRFRSRHRDVPVQLLTKWVPKPGPVTRADVRAAVGRALQRLDGETIDLLQFHAWTFADPRWLDAMWYLQELVDEGLIRHLGVTNFDSAHLRIAATSGVRVVSNQVCYSLIDARAAGRMTETCEALGIRLLAYGTVAGGFLSERWLGKSEPEWDRLETWSQMKYGRFIRAAGGWTAYQAVLRAASDVARKHGVSIANVASRWVLEQPAVAGVIIGARLGASEHVEDTARLFSFTLDDDDRACLADVRLQLTPIPGDTGDEYRRPPYLTASGDLSHHFESAPAPYATSTRGGRTLALSGTEWETIGGFARAICVGDRVLISGTTATHGTRAIGGDDVVAQTHFIIDKIEAALRSLGARLEDVVRTRIYVRRLEDWEAVARAHGERFGEVQPANTLVRAELVGEEYLVEMEAEAQIGIATR